MCAVVATADFCGERIGNAHIPVLIAAYALGPKPPAAP